MLRVLVLTTLLSVALAKCPNTMGVFPYYEQKMVGSWNMIMSTTVDQPENLKCAKFDFQIVNKGHLIVMNGVTHDNTVSQAEGFVKPSPYGESNAVSGNGHLVFKTPVGYSPVLQHTVLATDYENYLVILACGQVFDSNTMSFGRQVKVHILSRYPSISPDVVAVLRNLIAAHDIDINTVLPVQDMSACGN